ncbi:hypothetical protein DL546_009855 [Coniochaeta pulveracea]|uniref:Uncharacterized protein n=1 Tax=Coniochaeta pulveracea TaxID=177199 RepID=A0A420YP92_9PEZI|nr:hypothetical protein DL546_009855 [Coniochaeta pulveracea]
MDLFNPKPPPSKDKKHPSRTRLVKRISSRPTSPLLSAPPSVDSLPLPIPTTDANKVLLLMKTLCGRMKGEIEYQAGSTGPWQYGLCYIDDDKGCLMFDSGDMGPFHAPIIPDLRGCRVVPVDMVNKPGRCLEIVNHHGIEILLRPLMAEEYDLWLAALLCWQQLQPSGSLRPPNGRIASSSSLARSEMKRRASSSGLKESGSGSTIIKDNGAFKLMTENDVAVLSVIELSQLVRCAIQPVDKSVLEEEYCIGIFPIYSSTATHLSIFRPVYIALDTRVFFEVWFVLLRAFTVPGLHGMRFADGQTVKEVYEVADYTVEPEPHHFRVENTITIRITEAKLRKSSDATPEVGSQIRRAAKERDELVGNYLAEVILDGEVRARTTIKPETRNPFWREDCEFLDLPPTLPFLSVLLKRVDGNLTALGHQLQGSTGTSKSGDLIEVLCGCVDIPVHKLDRGKDHEQWLPINDERQQTIGTMLIKIHHDELVVLLEQQYAPIAELLHAFSTGLTAQIYEALQGNLRKLAEIFLNIFQVSGKATEWLMALVEDEIDGIGNQASKKKQPRFSRRLQSNESIESSSDREHFVRDLGKSLAGEANLLFRGNSLLTQALEFHMRRLGKEYLEDTLAAKIHEINEANADCEVDPSKIRPNEDINRHWTQLIRLTSEVWRCIALSAERIPTELRQVLKYIRAVAEDRYGDFLRTVTYTSVSGFLFLRFICPAILNPKLFGLLRDHPRPRAQRTLTLIAKGLQALANLSSIGKKETWTEPMNRFINTQRQPLKDFLDKVCSVSMERSASGIVAPVIYSTPLTILGRLTPLSREGFPSLPYLIDHARNFAMLVKLWTDVNGPSSSLETTRPSRIMEGDLLKFHNACVAIQKRADEHHHAIEAFRRMKLSTAVDEHALEKVVSPSQSETDRLLDLTEALNTATLADVGATPSSYGSSSTAFWLEQELNNRPPGSSGSDIETHPTPPSTITSNFSRLNPYSSNFRQVSGTSTVEITAGASPAGTMRKNGKNARKFLSGFIPSRKEKGRGVSPDPGEEGSSGWGRERGEDERDREREKDIVKDRNWGLGIDNSGGRKK